MSALFARWFVPKILALITISLWAGVSTRAQGGDGDPLADAWPGGGWALIEQYCIDCHNADVQEAELDLSSFEHYESAQANMMVWNRVLQMVRFGAMPPDDVDQPSEAERRTLADSLDRAIYNVSCDLRPKAGRVTARRLNRAEYQNTIRDLFGMRIPVSDDFPSDDVGGGFDNNADVLSMPPMLLEKYFDAAERISTTVVFDPATLQPEQIERAGDGIGVVGESVTESFYGRLLTEGSFAWIEFDLAKSGKYEIRLQGGAGTDDRLPLPFAVYDGQGKPLHVGSFTDSFESSKGQTIRFSREFAEGPQTLIVAALDRAVDDLADAVPFPHLDKLDDEQRKLHREQFGKGLTVDRRYDKKAMQMLIRKWNVEGPTSLRAEDQPRGQDAVIARTPKTDRGRSSESEVEKAAIESLAPLMRRAFRGPVDEAVVKRYAGLVRQAVDREQSFHRGMQIAISAILVSPRFLFRVETADDDAKPDEDGAHRLNDFQLATRLSYFLWSTMPDDELLKLAEENRLRDPAELRKQVERMLLDERARSLATEFASQWFGLRNLEGIERDNQKFPHYDEAIVESMAEETRQLFLHILRENRPVGELLSADYTFVDQRLADFYGLSKERDPDSIPLENGFSRVSLSGTPRRGVLTHASVLTLTSFPTRTSPVQRGKWILENVLGTPPPEPPPNVPELEATKTAAAGATVREQLALHRENPSCASCHRVMDQLGFGFEQFDAIGRYREDAQLDASGELPGGRTFNGGKQLAEILQKTESTRFALTAVEKLLGFALGRELSPDDRCVTEKMVSDCEKGDYPLADLVWQVVSSRPFQYFQPERKDDNVQP